jgi:hypothetical protein
MNPPMVLNHTHRYSVALLSGELIYSWFNISAALGNNTFEMSINNGVSYSTITIPDGVWTSCTLSAYIEDIFGDNGATPPVPNITIEELTYNGKWRITTVNNHLMDTGTLGPIIGFAKDLIIPLSTPTEGTLVTDFMGVVKAINISCNLVDNIKNHHNKGNANIVFSASTPVVNPFDRIKLVTTMPIPVAASQTSSINNVSVNILDHNLKTIQLTDTNTRFWLEVIDEGPVPGASKPVASI